jgi:hypothetical protein
MPDELVVRPTQAMDVPVKVCETDPADDRKRIVLLWSAVEDVERQSPV